MKELLAIFPSQYTCLVVTYYLLEHTIFAFGIVLEFQIITKKTGGEFGVFQACI